MYPVPGPGIGHLYHAPFVILGFPRDYVAARSGRLRLRLLKKRSLLRISCVFGALISVSFLLTACGKNFYFANRGYPPSGVLNRVLVAIQNEREWASFCAVVLGEPDLPKRSGFESNPARVANRPEVDSRVARVFSGLGRDEAAERLRRAGGSRSWRRPRA